VEADVKKNYLLLLMVVLVLASLACTISVPATKIKTAEIETLTVNEAQGDLKTPVDVKIGMGAGKLELSGGADKLIQGEIRYNVPLWRPEVKRLSDRLEVTQKGDNNFSGLPDKDVVNEWKLKLGKTPMNLTLEAGAYDGKLDLGGVPLRDLEIKDGASNVELDFSQPNPEKMRNFIYKTGASKVVLKNLGNANFEDMTVESGAGSYELDFSGNLQNPATVRISSGLSDLTLRIPSGVQCTVSLTGGVNNVNPSGTWTVDEKTYKTKGSGPLLKIKVDMGVGNLNLISED
jgi:hypothetical protein